MKHRLRAALASLLLLSSVPGVRAGTIDGGQDHTCALDSDGLAWCWGSDHSGQQGNGAGDDAATFPTRSGPAIQFHSLAVGGDHTCGLTPDGAVWCWGGNARGQVGDGTFDDQQEPFLVPGLVAKDIVAGQKATCAVRDNGVVACWGLSQISAPGSQSDMPSPTDVALGGMFALANEAVSVGGSHACALNGLGRAWCWGDNGDGQLGDGSTGQADVPPVAVDQPAGVLFDAIVAGGAHTCAIDQKKHVWCWGDGGDGQLGDGQSGSSPVPTAVAFPEAVNVVQLALGESSTCALDGAGTVWCWGSNFDRQSGVADSLADVPRPRRVQLPDSVRIDSLGAGERSTCAIDADSAVWCWGNGIEGELGLGYVGRSATPVTPPSSGLHSLDAGGFHTCALDAASNVVCWGYNNDGQLGRGTGPDSAVPLPVDASALEAGDQLVELSAGYKHTCALGQSGNAYCWGSGSLGQLGIGAQWRAAAPAKVAMPGGILLSQISAGVYHTCAVDTQGQLWCWGSNDYGQLGQGSESQFSPVQLDIPGVTFGSVTAGYEHTCAIEKPSGSVWCWGDNTAGQLGFGDTVDRSVPTKWAGLTNFGFTHVVAGDSHTCALRSVPGDNSISAVFCWGANGSGQIGDNTYANAPIAVSQGFVEGSGDTASAAHLSLGERHTCIRRPGGETECWGANNNGELDDGSFLTRNTPTVSLFTGVSELAAGDAHTCALDSAGSLACSGSRAYGQLGDGLMSLIAPPQQIDGFKAFTVRVFADDFED